MLQFLLPFVIVHRETQDRHDIINDIVILFFWNRQMDALLNIGLIYVNTRECLSILRVIIRTSFYILTSFNPNQTIIIQTIVGSTSVRILKCFRFGRNIKTSWHEKNFRKFNFPLQFNCTRLFKSFISFHHTKSICH